MCCSVEDWANINTVWASLIIEECSRLGLTVRLPIFKSFYVCMFYVFLIHSSLFQYFCVAPGSRSSPLAVAASTHPLITCMVCYDERSLAFHAVGYARGSQKPAVVITSSGTAVSNLLPAVSLLIVVHKQLSVFSFIVVLQVLFNTCPGCRGQSRFCTTPIAHS